MKGTYKALIVDDEPTAREILEIHLSKIDSIKVIASCKNAAEAFNQLSKTSIDLIFLDINMPEISGLMFANAIGKQTQIVFTTAHREYAADGFDLQAVDYLLKPISLERLIQAITKFTSMHSQKISEVPSESFTFIRVDRKMVKVDFEQLIFIESRGDYIQLHTKEQTFTTRETMSNILQKLPQSHFLRTHRSFVVQISKIDSYSNEHITMGRNAIPISRGYRDDVMSRLKRLE
jgi:DNA-binding LytR/AlgR family response regulator